MIPKIVEIGEIKVIGLQTTCQEAELAAERERMWKQFKHFADTIPNQTNGHMMEICLQKQGSLIKHCVAMEVESADIVPSGMTSFTIPPQSYIHIEHTGCTDTIWQSLYELKQWAKNYHCRLDPNHFTIDVTISEDPPTHGLYVKLEDQKIESGELVV
ncbi:GyrI-like domain-containing protein [Pseudobacillus wudalianchiensis]|uniref:Integron-associated effector binding protein domain-containing protein n=1 Tax=Pseudobacillus wudalianchiensis TaxID=1743143 RepID=A0A1B9AXX0_9BACI|nr:effector binding domain-containing protein [Bacillus wudalianchiensis]OCA88762.1 hypothetical protein A8F95_04770 [Bacillus wudalianchiensis]